MRYKIYIVSGHVNNMIHSILLSMFLFFFTSCVLAETEISKKQPEIHHFGPGVHNLDRIILEKPHSLVEGDGVGVTILIIKEGIWAIAPEPIIKNITIIGAGSGVGIKLSNTWSAKIENVEIENYKVGIKFELSEMGRKLAGGKTLNHWPGALTQGNHWGSRITLSEIRNVEIVGPGDGIVFDNKLKHTTQENYWKATDDNLNGEFINATTIWGGHIAVQGRAVHIGEGVGSTKIFGTYIDISPGGGISMEYGARGLTLVGVSLDPNSAARKAKTPKMVIPKRAKDSVKLVGMTVKNNDIDYTK